MAKCINEKQVVNGKVNIFNKKASWILLFLLAFISLVYTCKITIIKTIA